MLDGNNKKQKDGEDNSPEGNIGTLNNPSSPMDPRRPIIYNPTRLEQYVFAALGGLMSIPNALNHPTEVADKIVGVAKAVMEKVDKE